MAKISLEKRRAFGRRLRAARGASKLTQVQVAAKIGVTATTISAWELGTASPTANELARLRTQFGPLPSIVSIQRAERKASATHARRAKESATKRRRLRHTTQQPKPVTTANVRHAGRAPTGPHAEFAQRLRTARYAAAVNQVAMAKRAGVAAGTYAQWEQGHHLPRPAALGRLRDALEHHWGLPTQPASLAAWSAAGDDLGVSSADKSAAFLALDRFVARKLPAAAYTTKRVGGPGSLRPTVVAAITVAAHLIRGAREGRVTISQVGILGALIREWLSHPPAVSAAPLKEPASAKPKTPPEPRKLVQAKASGRRATSKQQAETQHAFAAD